MKTGGFAPDTQIQTNRGAVDISSLSPGDLVTTFAGETVAVLRIVRSSFQPAICYEIPACAFPNGPSKDLRLAGHKSVLISVVNHRLARLDLFADNTTISRVVDERDFVDIILAKRSIIIANCLAVESCGDEMVEPCLEKVDDTLTLAVIREQLFARAKFIGWVLNLTPSVDLHILADDLRVEPIQVGDKLRFHISADAKKIILQCQGRVPARVSGFDRRELGVCVSSISITDGFNVNQNITLSDSRLDASFHAFEGTHRWSRSASPLDPWLWVKCSHSFFLCMGLEPIDIARYEPQC